jgi:ubiquinone/menaquinone biosynthesis C-methylase UbiE
MRSKQLQEDQTFKEKIHQANISVHKHEAECYELLHPEVYIKQEQKRIAAKLEMIGKLVDGNQHRALDVGAGTGNLTGKLLMMGYEVTSVDISSEMCAVLQRKYRSYIENNKLIVVKSPIENLAFDAGKFDLITCYSVLHHLPDYLMALRCLSVFLKKGGVIYIDHEESPFYWKNESSSLSTLVKFLYFHSNPPLNSLYFQIIGLKVPFIDYSLSDYWGKKEHSLDHKAIGQVFKEENYAYSKRTDYYQSSTWIPNPLSIIYRFTCNPEMSFWIAKK